MPQLNWFMVGKDVGASDLTVNMTLYGMGWHDRIHAVDPK